MIESFESHWAQAVEDTPPEIREAAAKALDDTAELLNGTGACWTVGVMAEPAEDPPHHLTAPELIEIARKNPRECRFCAVGGLRYVTLHAPYFHFHGPSFNGVLMYDDFNPNVRQQYELALSALAQAQGLHPRTLHPEWIENAIIDWNDMLDEDSGFQIVVDGFRRAATLVRETL